MRVVGVDLGCLQDYTGIVSMTAAQSDGGGEPYWYIDYICRPPLGTKYIDIAALLRDYIASSPAGIIAVDATGVGTAVVEILRTVNLGRIVPITITGGTETTTKNGGYHVPKQEIIGTLQAIIEQRLLKVKKSLSLGKTLVDEMHNFRVKYRPTATIELSAWRERDHDDLVLACAIAVWAGERFRLRSQSPIIFHRVPAPPPKSMSARQFVKLLLREAHNGPKFLH